MSAFKPATSNFSPPGAELHSYPRHTGPGGDLADECLGRLPKCFIVLELGAARRCLGNVAGKPSVRRQGAARMPAVGKAGTPSAFSIRADLSNKACWADRESSRGRPTDQPSRGRLRIAEDVLKSCPTSTGGAPRAAPSGITGPAAPKPRVAVLPSGRLCSAPDGMARSRRTRRPARGPPGEDSGSRSRRARTPIDSSCPVAP